MKYTQKSFEPREKKEAYRSAATPVVLKSVLAAALISLSAGGVALALGRLGLSPPPFATDHASQSERQIRMDAFAAMAPLTLDIVRDKDEASALDSMGLPPAEQATLEASVFGKQPNAATEQAMPVRPNDARPEALPVRQEKTERLRLAWLTLWDTDAQDGDVVRIDSNGYSRIVTLTKEPRTFAVPVPTDGVVHVIGIRDGDGGGITVGLASGASRAVFPIMRPDQTLGLKVSVN